MLSACVRPVTPPKLLRSEAIFTCALSVHSAWQPAVSIPLLPHTPPTLTLVVPSATFEEISMSPDRRASQADAVAFEADPKTPPTCTSEYSSPWAIFTVPPISVETSETAHSPTPESDPTAPPKLMVPLLSIEASPVNFAVQSVMELPELPQTMPALQVASPPFGTSSEPPKSAVQLSIEASAVEPTMPPAWA